MSSHSSTQPNSKCWRQTSFPVNEPPEAKKISLGEDNVIQNLKLCLKYVMSERKSLSCIRFFATPWTVACKSPLSLEFSQQECWSRLPFSSPGDLPDPGIRSGSSALHMDYLLSEPLGKPEAFYTYFQTFSQKLPDIQETALNDQNPGQKNKHWEQT